VEDRIAAAAIAMVVQLKTVTTNDMFSKYVLFKKSPTSKGKGMGKGKEGKGGEEGKDDLHLTLFLGPAIRLFCSCASRLEQLALRFEIRL